MNPYRWFFDDDWWVFYPERDQEDASDAPVYARLYELDHAQD